jgi:hypothetical protein
MVISELIEKLEQVKEKHGDLPVLSKKDYEDPKPEIEMGDIFLNLNGKTLCL